MKITTIDGTRDDGYEGWFETRIKTDDGKVLSASFGSGEPEDMSIARDLNDALYIKDMLIMAYNGGKNGEELEIEELTEE